MKNLLLFFFLISSFCCFSQENSEENSTTTNTEGVITYKVEIVNPRAAEIRARIKERGFNIDIPDVNTSTMNLFFNDSESIFKQEETDEEEYDGRQVGGGRGGGRRFRFFGAGGDFNGYYRKLGSRNYLQEKDLVGRKFLIEDEEKDYKWKITGRTEQLAEYQVMEAMTIHDEDTIQVWFTPQIPVSSGPSEFSQLPGLVLRVDVNHGKKLMYATSIDLRPLTEDEAIEVPKKGKKITLAEYAVIREEKIEELRELYGEERANRFIGTD